MSDNDTIQGQARQQLQQFLLAKKLRQTRERFAILEAAYEIEGFFTIEDLQERLHDKNFIVSTASLYNTTALLVQANLLLRHPFSTSSSVFERIADNRPRCYQICNCCQRITRISSKEVAHVVNTYHPRRFNATHRVLYVYGLCPKCDKPFHKTRQLTLEL